MLQDHKFADLIERFKAGEQDEVIEILANDHPGLVAVMLVQGIQDRDLSRNECNKIANLLADRRRELFIAQDLYAKGYRYQLAPKHKTFEPLYVKTISAIASTMRMYPDTTFNVSHVVATENGGVKLVPPKVPV